MTAPYKTDNRTPADGYRQGYRTGRNWRYQYRPGGPWVCRANSYDRDPEWIAYCARTAEINRQWLLGWEAGMRDAGRSL